MKKIVHPSEFLLLIRGNRPIKSEKISLYFPVETYQSLHKEWFLHWLAWYWYRNGLNIWWNWCLDVCDYLGALTLRWGGLHVTFESDWKKAIQIVQKSKWEWLLDLWVQLGGHTTEFTNYVRATYFFCTIPVIFRRICTSDYLDAVQNIWPFAPEWPVCLVEKYLISPTILN